ncbi:ABC transporter permease subunit [Pseudactinotalea sp. HY160]|uniref:ABC transporter permease n=1 Tax=Pseudactinotalea sp. HY160 TaxID=2654490 RepID=UPI00128D811E|nr:ABC transporter permease [Pseudactinotalea sp. HY160]MPV48581.1 ABC transporter permease subunit [Pseudactinotalea sp. HY160]
MNLLADAWAWLFSAEPLAGGDGIWTAIGVHLAYTFAAVGLAALVAVPLGWWIGHTGRGREVAVTVSGAARAVPSFGLLVLLVLLFGVLHKPLAALISYVLLAIPSLLAGAYAGCESIDRRVIGAARAVGMTEWQILRRVEIPLGRSLLVGGIRAAVLQVIATVTIGAYVGLGGLGQYIIAGIPLRRYDMVLGGALVLALTALILDGAGALAQRAAVPRGLRTARAAGASRASRASGSATGAVSDGAVSNGAGTIGDPSPSDTLDHRAEASSVVHRSD